MTLNTQPEIVYRPQNPKSYSPGIALVGCGGITSHHLTAYKAAGYRVLALCDLDEAAAEKRREEYFPQALVTTDLGEVLSNDEIEVVDITTHPPVRPALIEAALKAGKHVLSQKPFVLDLDVGERLVELAAKYDRKLAVNQNGRWAPHFSYIMGAIRAGVLGRVSGAHLSVHWDHSWVKGTEFAKIKHLILYDYAIHWFDIVSCFMQEQTPRRVFASTAATPTQSIEPALLGQALIEYDHAQASLAFDAHTLFGSQDRTYVAGELGSASSVGPGNSTQSLTLTTSVGTTVPELVGKWFSDGFHGTMGELLCAIEEDREPTNSGANNLTSLALCFAAIASADTGLPQTPGAIRRIEM